ncbi:hypothetical protein SCLCIDRAFT_29402 [Scleroderma citrinum Foug A]|uniref:Uncharacterized protein n=1 Tax=Scleroderma citrinum Foug A TaxID=1036808 RepID=A0A0C2Z413_9AGAM|nr:hypothetical protein SCLCIDRAFT_29402 [Scleroderma citrinum Foug A]
MVLNIAPRLPRLPALKGLQIDRITITRPRFEFNLAMEWLRESGLSQLYRSDLDAATLMAGSMDSVLTFWRVSEWLGESGLSQSSVFAPKLPQHPGPEGLFLDQIALTCPKYKFYSSAMMAGYMDPMESFRRVSGWLHNICALQGRCPTTPYGRSAGLVGGLDDTVNAAAACCVAHVTNASIVTVTSVSIATAITSSLALDNWRNPLFSALDLSERKRLTQHLNRRIPRYIHINIFDADTSPSMDRL